MIEPSTSPVPNNSLHTVPVEGMNLYKALELVIDNNKIITKKDWDNRNIYGILVDNILMLHKEDGKLYQWILSKEDFQGNDWIIIEGSN